MMYVCISLILYDMALRSILKTVFVVIPVYLLIAGCAKVSSPTGGPRDLEPPIVIKSVPPQSSRYFTDKRIVVTFDEYIALDQVNEKFMVSPPMNKKPEITIKGKSIIIEYEDDLRDSTTYTFYLQDAIRDLNESNAINNYSFVFSTGPVIDSLSVTGNVYNALDLNPPENTLVMLYSNLSDSAFKKTIPDYITRADKKGYFRIDNVKEGRYNLFALKDADNSKNFNLADEEVAFLDSSIYISKEKNYLPVLSDSLPQKQPGSRLPDTVFIQGDYKLILFKPPKKQHYLTSSSRSLAYKLNYTLSLPPDSSGFGFSIPGADGSDFIIETNKDRDSIQVWLRDTSLYLQPLISPVIRYPFTDSAGNIVQRYDTTHLRFQTQAAPRSRQKSAPYRITSSVSAGFLRPDEQIVFNSQTPFREPDTSKIRLYKLSETAQTVIPYLLVRDSINSCRIIMKADLPMGQNYLLVADSLAFGNIYGEQADSTGNKFVVKEDADYGKLILNVENFKGKRIIQLMTGDEKLVREVHMEEDGKTEFPYLDKGMYRVRIIYDLNGDGKFTTGDFDVRRQPEPVSFMPVEIEILENWENELYWDVSEKNIKKYRDTDTGKPASPGRR